MFLFKIRTKFVNRFASSYHKSRFSSVLCLVDFCRLSDQTSKPLFTVTRFKYRNVYWNRAYTTEFKKRWYNEIHT